MRDLISCVCLSVIRDVSSAGLKRRCWSVTLLRLLLTCEAGDVCCHSQKSDRDCLVLIKRGMLASEAPHPLESESLPLFLWLQNICKVRRGGLGSCEGSGLSLLEPSSPRSCCQRRSRGVSGTSSKKATPAAPQPCLTPHRVPLHPRGLSP